LLQVATPQTIFIFDLLALEGSADHLIGALLTDHQIIKLGIDFNSDLRNLAKDYLESTCYQACAPLMDVPQVFGLIEPRVQQPVGLKRMCLYALQQRVDKEQQVSNWNSRPLSPEQVEYAALDAFSLLMLYDVLNERASSEGLDVGQLTQEAHPNQTNYGY